MIQIYTITYRRQNALLEKIFFYSPQKMFTCKTNKTLEAMRKYDHDIRTIISNALD